MANRYWVGGSDTWDATAGTKWSLTSGGAGGQAVPTTSDAVFFTAASGASTVTIDVNAVCLTLTMTGFTGTLAFGSNKISIAGNGTTILTGATTYSVTGTPLIELTYAGASGIRTFNPSATTEANAISINVIAGTDIVRSTGTNSYKNYNFTGFGGTLNLSPRNVYGNVIFNATMSHEAGASALTFSATSGTQLFTSAKTLDFPITINGIGGTVQLQDSLTIGSTRTFTLTNGILDLFSKTLTTGLFSSSGSGTRSILFGTSNITINGSGTVWNTGTATNFSYTGTPTVNISNNSATATTVTTGALSESQALNFNYTVGTYTLTDTSSVYKSLNFTGFTGTASNSARTIYGNLTLVSGMTLTAGANATTFATTSGTQTITTAAKTLDFPLTFNGVGGTFAFQDALTQGSTRAFTITNGTVQLKAGVTSTVGSFVASSTAVKYLRSTTPGSQATISQASGTVSVSDLTIQDSNTAGSASWNAYVDFENTDAGNNDGWNFSLSPPYASYEPPIIIRSFTQPRRF